MREVQRDGASRQLRPRQSLGRKWDADRVTLCLTFHNRQLFSNVSCKFVARVKGWTMMHPPRFLDNILERPDDDSPRLRYANWLDGCGNPLGEFIRLQCLLARHPNDAPLLDDERRAQALLATFQRDWSRALADRVDWCSFRR